MSEADIEVADPPAAAAPDEAPAADAPAPAPAAPPAKPGRGKRFWAGFEHTLLWMKEHYFVMEPRTAGLFRIVLGFLCAADLLRHWGVANVFYSNDGVLTNHYHLFRPSSGYNFSAFHAFSSLGEVHVIFAFFLFCNLAFMVGWRTKLFSFLSFISVTSLDNRLVMVENGGYVVVNLAVAYAMFLPTERRFSIDALLRSYREKKERTVAELNEHARPAWATEPFISLAVFLVILNLGVIYFFNVVNKSGEIWRRGETVHYVLFLNRMVTGFGVLMREVFPFWMTKVFTWVTLAFEALLVPWILSPYAKRLTRTLAICGVIVLHTMFGTVFRLGPFAWFLVGWSFLLWAPPQWEALEAWYRERAPARVVVLDRGSPFAFAVGRLLARLDCLELLRFEESPPDAASPELLAARDPESGRVFTGVAAFREIVTALPGGRWAFWIVRVGTLGLLGPILAAAGARRAGLARYFGLTVPPGGRAIVEEPSPLRLRARTVKIYLREALLAYVAVCSVLQAIAENKAVPTWAKPTMPGFMSATLVYPRMFQGWGMFAPNPITDDGSVSVDAVTLDGRHVDPFTGEAPDLDISDARGLGIGQIRQDYFNRIRLDRNKVYREGLKQYLLSWHKQTGRPEDELVAFDVYWVRALCPPPGQKKMYQNEIVALLTYRKPGYRPPPGQPPLPPEPKVESADTIDKKSPLAPVVQEILNR